MLGVMIHKKLIFNAHINAICKKTGLSRTTELSRTTPFMELLKARLLMNVFYMSQFSFSL